MIKETTVKNSKKAHDCYLCGQEISGEHHIKVFSVRDREPRHYRAHLLCYEMAQKMCDECDYRDDCFYDIFECFYNPITREESL